MAVEAQRVFDNQIQTDDSQSVIYEVPLGSHGEANFYEVIDPEVRRSAQALRSDIRRNPDIAFGLIRDHKETAHKLTASKLEKQLEDISPLTQDQLKRLAARTLALDSHLLPLFQDRVLTQISQLNPQLIRRIPTIAA